MTAGNPISERNLIFRWIHQRRTELQFGTRVTIAGLTSFAVAEMVALPQGYWAVFTAVLVTQASVGGSLTAARDRLVGTLGGAAYSAMVAVLIPHSNPYMLGLALTISLAPLAALAAINPVFRVAPVTAVIILLGTAGTQEGPVAAALLRTVEVSLGGLIGLAVSVLVLPKRGSVVMFETANRILTQIAALLDDLISGFTQPLDQAMISRQHDKVQTAFDKMEAAQAEAERERKTFLSEEIDLAPLSRTLRRIYHDVVLIGRVAARPLSGTNAETAQRAIQQATAYIQALGAALVRRMPPPAAEGFEAALRDLAVQTAIAPVPGANSEDDGRRATLSFALEQMQRDCRDLAERAREYARANRDVKSSPS